MTGAGSNLPTAVATRGVPASHHHQSYRQGSPSSEGLLGILGAKNAASVGGGATKATPRTKAAQFLGKATLLPQAWCLGGHMGGKQAATVWLWRASAPTVGTTSSRALGAKGVVSMATNGFGPHPNQFFVAPPPRQ